MHRGRLPTAAADTLSVDGPERPSGRTASSAGTPHQPSCRRPAARGRSRTEISPGARAHRPSIAPARRLSSASRSAHRPPHRGDRAPPAGAHRQPRFGEAEPVARTHKTQTRDHTHLDTGVPAQISSIRSARGRVCSDAVAGAPQPAQPRQAGRTVGAPSGPWRAVNAVAPHVPARPHSGHDYRTPRRVAATWNDGGLPHPIPAPELSMRPGTTSRCSTALKEIAGGDRSGEVGALAQFGAPGSLSRRRPEPSWVSRRACRRAPSGAARARAGA
jgi:hypothetical protein